MLEEFKKGDKVFIVYHHEVVKAQIVAIHKEFKEIELNYLEGKTLWVGIIKAPWACFKTKEEAEKYLIKMRFW